MQLKMLYLKWLNVNLSLSRLVYIAQPSECIRGQGGHVLVKLAFDEMACSHVVSSCFNLVLCVCFEFLCYREYFVLLLIIYIDLG